MSILRDVSRVMGITENFVQNEIKYIWIFMDLI